MLDYRGLFEGWEIALAKELIDRFRSRWRSLERENTDDLLQECLFHWYGVRDRYEPGRELLPRAFMARVLGNKLMDFVRKRDYDKRRTNYETTALEEHTVGDDGLSRRSRHEELQVEAAGADEQCREDLRIDLASALKALTPRQRRLCELLGAQGLSVREASRCLRISPVTLYAELRRIKKIFADQGLGDYLLG